ncbi:MAG: hypothetical protein WC607_03270 [Candidatus Micrarchaeia archaeon]
MTVIGDNLIQSCRQCYSHEGYAVPLEPRDGKWGCPRCKSAYLIKDGNLHRV